jgi:hypothetical protein
MITYLHIGIYITCCLLPSAMHHTSHIAHPLRRAPPDPRRISTETESHQKKRHTRAFVCAFFAAS